MDNPNGSIIQRFLCYGTQMCAGEGKQGGGLRVGEGEGGVEGEGERERRGW